MAEKLLKGQSPYPVGATWVARGSKGNATIWLVSRNFANGRCSEMWKWAWRYNDGSGREGDWGPTKRSVREECPSVDGWKEKPTARFKRVKDTP